MEQKNFVLRVFSVKEIRPPYDNVETRCDPPPAVVGWEVRADSIDALPVSLFYRETGMQALPQVGTLINIKVVSTVPPPPPNPGTVDDEE